MVQQITKKAKYPILFSFVCEDQETYDAMRLEVQKRFPKAHHIQIRDESREARR